MKIIKLYLLTESILSHSHFKIIQHFTMNFILKIKLSFIRKFYKTRNKEITNIVNSISKAKQLYKSLIIQAHPDKHPDKKELAQKITSLINENRYNYDALVKLKNTIEREL